MANMGVRANSHIYVYLGTGWPGTKGLFRPTVHFHLIGEQTKRNKRARFVSRLI